MTNPFENMLYTLATQLLAVFWPYILALIAINLAFWFLSTARFKGWLGERAVDKALRSRLSHREYRVLKDLTMPTSDGGTTQIDHIVVSRFGVFVIETKNWSGQIYGREKEARWTRKRHRHRKPIENPLRQNHKHVKTVQELLSVPEYKIHNVVVFVGDATMEREMPANVLFGGRDLIDYIKSKRQVVFDERQVHSIVQLIEKNRLERGRKTNRAHLRYLRQAEDARRQKGAAKGKNARPKPATDGDRRRQTGAAKGNNARQGTRLQCPQCGARMTRKINRSTGRRFLVCSRFPQHRMELPQSG